MDHIAVYDDDILVHEYGESELMRCGSKVFDTIDKFYATAPRFVLTIYMAWHMSSNLDGDNPSLRVEFDGLLYIFTNFHDYEVIHD